MERILEEWEHFARSIRGTAGMPQAELRDHARAILKRIAHDMARPQSDAAQNASRAASSREIGGERGTAAAAAATTPPTRCPEGPLDSLGLGLYICCEVVKAHGGRITADSSRAQGTTFTVRLPRRAKS